MSIFFEPHAQTPRNPPNATSVDDDRKLEDMEQLTGKLDEDPLDVEAGVGLADPRDMPTDDVIEGEIEEETGDGLGVI